MLLVQGQDDLPTIADLIEVAPITTRGYLHDYVPAWTLRNEFEQHGDYALVKLFKGKGTVVQRRHWPALNALAVAAHEVVLAAGDSVARILRAVEATPGITGDELKKRLALKGTPGTRAFQRDKTKLEQWLCVEGRDQEESEHHTHDSVWFPWAQAKAAMSTRLSIKEAVGSLWLAVYEDAPLDAKQAAKAFPAWSQASRS